MLATKTKKWPKYKIYLNEEKRKKKLYLPLSFKLSDNGIENRILSRLFVIAEQIAGISNVIVANRLTCNHAWKFKALVADTHDFHVSVDKL